MSWRDERQVDPQDVDDRPPNDSWLKEVAPELNDLLCNVPKGAREKKRGTMLLIADRGKWKVCLNDRATGMVLWLSRDSLGPDFIGWVSACLREKKGSWRPNKGLRPK